MITRRRLLVGSGVAAVVGATYVGRKLSGSGGDVVAGHSRARAIPTETVPPASADVVVIGGGLVGSAIAYYLAKQGISVALCEKGAIGCEASGRSQGVVAGIGLSPVKLPLVQQSQQLWSGLNREVQIETGYRQVGATFGFRDPAELAYWQGWLDEVRAFMPGARVLSVSEANAKLPATQPWLGAYYDPNAGGVEPTLAAPALAEAAQKLGAHVVAPCAVRGVEMQAGRISHAVTESGAIRTNAVVLAGGAWSTLFAQSIGVKFPSLSIFSTVMKVTGVVGGPTGVFGAPEAGGRLGLDGLYTLGTEKGRIAITPAVLAQLWDFRQFILSPPWDVQPHLGEYFFRQLWKGSHWKLDGVSPFERNRILQPSINTDVTRQVVSGTKAEFSAFANMRIVETWGGAISTTPDNMPVISAIEAVPGLFLASGFSFGMTMAPAAGQAMADLINARTPAFDLHPYRHGRFTDGSKLTFVE